MATLILTWTPEMELAAGLAPNLKEVAILSLDPHLSLRSRAVGGAQPHLHSEIEI